MSKTIGIENPVNLALGCLPFSTPSWKSRLLAACHIIKKVGRARDPGARGPLRFELVGSVSNVTGLEVGLPALLYVVAALRVGALYLAS